MKKLFIFILLLFSFIKVSAKESVSVDIEWIPNVYYNYKVGNLTYWGQAGYFYVDGKLAYCLELSKKITTSSYYITTDEVENNIILLFGYFGYGYDNQINYKHYLATQKLIWKYTDGYDVYFTTESEGRGNVINIRDNEANIISNVNKYGLFPNIGSNFKFRYKSLNVINDSNSIINNFNIINDSNNNIDFVENGLIIDAKEKGDFNFTLEKKFNYISDNVIYAANDSQKLMVIGNVSNLYNKYFYSVESGTFSFCIKTKLSDNEYFSNKFKLYKEGNEYGTYTLNENGCVYIDAIEDGEYELEHYKGLDNYKKLESYYFEIYDNSDIHKDFYLNKIVTNVDIKKEYGYSKLDYIKPDDNVKYEIYKDDELISDVCTNEEGIISITLEYGNYRIVQKSINNINKYHDDIYINKEDFKSSYNFYIYDELDKLRVKLIPVNDDLEVIDKFEFDFLDNHINADNYYLTDLLDYGIYTLTNINSTGYEVIDKYIIDVNENCDIYLENDELIMDVYLKFKKEEIEDIENLIIEEDVENLTILDEVIDADTDILNVEVENEVVEKLPFLGDSYEIKFKIFNTYIYMYNAFWL